MAISPNAPATKLNGQRCAARFGRTWVSRAIPRREGERCCWNPPCHLQIPDPALLDMWLRR
jgi:hypothetical protein